MTAADDQHSHAHAEQHGSSRTPTAPFVPVQTRSERFRSVNVDDFEPVNGREHEWKLSPVAAVRRPHGRRPRRLAPTTIESTDVPGVAI